MHFSAEEVALLKRAIDAQRRAVLDELAHTEAPPLKPEVRKELEQLEFLEMKLSEMRPGTLVEES